MPGEDLSVQTTRRDLVLAGVGLVAFAGCAGTEEDDRSDPDGAGTDDDSDGSASSNTDGESDSQNQSEDSDPQDQNDGSDDQNAEDESDDQNADELSSSDADFRLEAIAVDGWRGMHPDEIEGRVNPELSLTAGESYVIEWENADGRPHNFVVANDDGEILFETGIMDHEGETQIFEMTAEEGMRSYYCRPHPSTMLGEVRVQQ